MSTRLYACNAIINVLALVLNYDRHSHEDIPTGSRLLSTPVPELTVEVLSRTGKAIFSLRRTGKIQLQTARIMLSVLFGVLTILSSISVTASLVLASFKRLNLEEDLQIKLDVQYSAMGPTAGLQDARVLSECDPLFFNEVLREAQLQANLGPFSLNQTIKKYEEMRTHNDLCSAGGGECST